MKNRNRKKTALKKYDLHIHTKYSECGIMAPESVVKIAKKKGFNGIAITDHDTVKGAIEAKKANKSRDFEVIVGEEVSTNQGDVAAFYVKKEIKPGKFEDVIMEIKRQGAICMMPHPFSKGFIIRRTSGDDVVRYADAVEVINGRTLAKNNKKALNAAKRLRKAETGGSDAHFWWEIGNAYTEFEGSLRSAVSGRKTKAKGRSGFSFINRALSLLPKFKNIIFKY